MEDGGSLKKVALDGKALGQVMRSAVKEVEPLRKKLVDMAAVGMGIDSMNRMFADLTAVVNDLCGAYDMQVEAETKLMTVMQQRMNATEAEIQSIKDLCSSQQQIGVIGDEVQLAVALIVALVAADLKKKSD